jgi:hypothetical protein
MNIREVEALLWDIKDRYSILTTSEMDMRLSQAINWCRVQQRARRRRKLEFKLKAAEQREALR